MKFFSAVVAAIALATSASAAFTSCGSSTDVLQLSSVTYTPVPPKVGQSICITLRGTLGVAVTEGATIAITATFLGINVYSNSGDLCAGLAGSATPCPLTTAVTSVSDCITVPSNVPAGIALTLKATATNPGGQRIFCISGPLTFSN